jgi:hypothetical protein
MLKNGATCCVVVVVVVAGLPVDIQTRSVVRLTGTATTNDFRQQSEYDFLCVTSSFAM